ncbi:hypothetical protein [Lysobacter sp. Root983]|uniref:hypothetical protein n=1 Tax=Lysobacter sp. Root983 TaxID=1736613 RepID=UPI0007098B12|nr:hypothetical protein [Lysobacter sp. Root983]KRD76933.1 hypothetical protein ASE43_07045 [Lysobacter sp. Root983]
MALVPKIDQPCPLGIDELRRLNGYCGHCKTQVHALDGLSEAERRALLQAASGPICVSYGVPRPAPARRGAGFGLAIAATLVSGGAFAADPPSLLAPAATEPAATPVAATPLLPAADAVECESTELDFVTITGGGVSDPQDAQWVDDSDLPELPMRDAAHLDSASALADLDDESVARPER